MDPNTNNNGSATQNTNSTHSGAAVSRDSMDAVLRSLKRSHSEIVLTFEALKTWSQEFKPTLGDVEFDITEEITRIKAVGDYFSAQNAILAGNTTNGNSNSN